MKIRKEDTFLMNYHSDNDIEAERWYWARPYEVRDSALIGLCYGLSQERWETLVFSSRRVRRRR